MPRSTVYPYQSNGFQRSFNQGATYPSARYESDDEENELERARELYKNLQGSPGGLQTRALQGQSQQLKRRLGENQQQFQQRAQEYERRIREGEDARSLLGSQLDDSRIEYGGLQRRYGELESQANQRNKEREEKRKAFQEAYDKDYIEKQLLPVIQKHYSLSNYPGYKDLESMQDPKLGIGTGYKPGMTGEEYKNKWNLPKNERVYNVYKQFPAYQPPEYPQKMDLYTRYGGLKTDYDNLQKRNSETESLYQGKIADYERRLQEEYGQHASEMQSQSERFSHMYDQALEPFAQYLKQINPQQYSEIISREQKNPKFSQSSIYSLQAPQSFYGSIKSLYDTEQQNRQKGEQDLHQLRGQYDQHLKKYTQDVQNYEQNQNRLTGESQQWKGKHDSLLPVIQEYQNYRREVSPLRREYPSLKNFQKQYSHVNLKTYDQIPGMKKTYEEGGAYVNKFKNNYNELLKRKKAVDQFIHYYPGTGSGLYKALGYGKAAQTMNPWPWASK